MDKPYNASEQKRNCHVKLMIVDDCVGIQGIYNPEYFAWMATLKEMINHRKRKSRQSKLVPFARDQHDDRISFHMCRMGKRCLTIFIACFLGAIVCVTMLTRLLLHETARCNPSQSKYSYVWCISIRWQVERQGRQSACGSSRSQYRTLQESQRCTGILNNSTCSCSLFYKCLLFSSLSALLPSSGRNKTRAGGPSFSFLFGHI